MFFPSAAGILSALIFQEKTQNQPPLTDRLQTAVAQASGTSFSFLNRDFLGELLSVGYGDSGGTRALLSNYRYRVKEHGVDRLFYSGARLVYFLLGALVVSYS